MNTRYYMVIIKGEIKTSEIMSCGYNRNNQKWDVKFNNGKTYSYAYLNVEKLTDPEVLNPNMYRISREGREFFDVNAIYVFRSRYESYWHICFGNGSERDYHRSELNIVESCLTQSQSSNVFEYIKQIAGLSNIRNEETGEKLLSKRFDKISFVGSDVALARYLNPSSLQGKRTGREYNPIFPFGCNNSQYKAVKSAMENQISVIQGPPGTGKTQTILNIIANILMQGKTVQIVSNNNSAKLQLNYEEARERVERYFAELQYFLSVEYESNMELIDSRINNYYNLANTRIMLMASNGVRLESVINDFLNTVSKMTEEEQNVAMEKVADCIRITNQKYVGYKSFEKNKRVKNEGENIGLVTAELSEEEKRMQTEKLFNCSPNRYSVDRVSTFLGVQLGSEDEMNIKEKTIQTKEEVLMYAAAMLYANNSEFPYDIQLSEETVKTEIADITDITVIKK